MPNRTDSEQQIVDYLLGAKGVDYGAIEAGDTGISPGEAELEQRFLHDDEFFARFQETEDRLVQDYIRGRLTPQEKALFEKNYLASETRRRDVSLAWTAKRFFQEEKGKRRSDVWAAIAFAAALLVITVYLGARVWKLQQEASLARAAAQEQVRELESQLRRERVRVSQLQLTEAPERLQGSLPGTAAVVTGVRRGEALQVRLVLRQGVQAARLRVELYRRTQLVQLLRLNLAGSERIVEFYADARSLAPGLYQVRLFDDERNEHLSLYEFMLSD